MARVVVKNRSYHAVNTQLLVAKKKAVVAKSPITAVSCDDDLCDSMDNLPTQYSPPSGLQGPQVGLQGPQGVAGLTNPAPKPVWFTTTPSSTNYITPTVTSAQTASDVAMMQALQQQIAIQKQLMINNTVTVGPPTTPVVRKYRPVTSGNVTNNHVIVNSGISVANSTTYFNVYDDSDCCTPEEYEAQRNNGWRIADGVARVVTLPDGAKLDVKADGSYEMIDKDAKVVYRACRVRDFNPFLNASDKLEDFIRFCGTVGVRQSEVLRLPVELFVAWLVISAARADGEPEPDVPLIPKLKRRALPRCNSCGQFLSRLKRQKRLDFCKPKCFETFYDRALVPA